MWNNPLRKIADDSSEISLTILKCAVEVFTQFYIPSWRWTRLPHRWCQRFWLQSRKGTMFLLPKFFFKLNFFSREFTKIFDSLNFSRMYDPALKKVLKGQKLDFELRFWSISLNSSYEILSALVQDLAHNLEVKWKIMHNPHSAHNSESDKKLCGVPHKAHNFEVKLVMCNSQKWCTHICVNFISVSQLGTTWSLTLKVS